MKTIIYLRVSTEEQNVQNQLEDCVKLAEGQEYEIFQDKQSAYKDLQERKEFTKVLKKIRTQEVNNVIVWDLDRIYRNRLRLKSFFNYCKAYKCKVHSVRQHWLKELNDIPEPFGDIVHELMVNIMGWIGEEESSKKSDRVKASISKKDGVTKSKYGNKWGRKSLSTFKKNKIISMRKEGLSMGKISKELNVAKGTVHKTITQESLKNA